MFFGGHGSVSLRMSETHPCLGTSTVVKVWNRRSGGFRGYGESSAVATQLLFCPTAPPGRLILSKGAPVLLEMRSWPTHSAQLSPSRPVEQDSRQAALLFARR